MDQLGLVLDDSSPDEIHVSSHGRLALIGPRWPSAYATLHIVFIAQSLPRINVHVDNDWTMRNVDFGGIAAAVKLLDVLLINFIFLPKKSPPPPRPASAISYPF